MQNYVPLVFIGKDTAVAAVTGLSSTADGGIVLLNSSYTPLAAGATVSSNPYIHIARFSTTANDHFLSPRIYGNQVASWSGKSYTAPVAQISYIGNIGSGVLDIEVNAETDYTITVVDENETDSFFYIKRYNYRSTSTDTNDTIADALVTAVNDDDTSIVTAAKVTTGAYRGVSLTADTAGNPFSTGLSGGFGITTVTDASTKPVRGSGTYAQVTDLESMSKGTRGHMNRVWFPFSGFPSHAVSGATYDLYHMTYYNQFESNQPGVMYEKAPCQITIAVPAGPSNWEQATHEATLNNWLASSTGAFPAVNL